MTVTLTLCAVIFALLYFRKAQSDYVRQGVIVGTIWFIMSILVDAPLFLIGGPMLMTFQNYMMDIGLTYLIYPIVTIGFGWLLAHR